MKKRAVISLIAGATIGTSIGIPMAMSHQNNEIINKVLMSSNTSTSRTNEAVVVSGNSQMNLYALSNGKGIISNLSTGEMLSILGQQGSYCKVKVQETGAIGYINVANMQRIINGTNVSLAQLSKNGQIVNVSTRVRLRSNPSINANIVSYLKNGFNVKILGKQGQWYKVSINGQIGFIYEEYIALINNNQQVTSAKKNSSKILTNTKENNSSNNSTSSNNISGNNRSNSVLSNSKNISTNKLINKTTGNKITTTKVVTNNNSSNNSPISIKNNNRKDKDIKANNKIDISSYKGVWNPTVEVWWDSNFTKNVKATNEQLANDKLTLTKSLYSFNGITIKNPSYHLVTISKYELFGNMSYGDYGPVSKAYNNMGAGSELTFIVPLAQGQNESYVRNHIGTLGLTRYPYICNGNLYGFINTIERPIYKFTKE